MKTVEKERDKLVDLLYIQADVLKTAYKKHDAPNRPLLTRLTHTVQCLFRTLKLSYEDKERLVSRLYAASDANTQIESTQIHQVEDGPHAGSIYVNGYFDIKTLQQHIIW